MLLQFLKYRYDQGKEANLYFWLDLHGHETGCLIEYRGSDLIPVDMKSGRTANNDYFKEIVYWNALSGNTPDRSFVVYGGDLSQQRTAGHLIGYADLDPVLDFLR